MLPGFFTPGSAALATSGAALCAAGLIPLAWALLALLTRDPRVDMDAITPAFVQHITERQRLQRELETARAVQQSFLPKSDPAAEGLEVASRCVPAQEEGGD